MGLVGGHLPEIIIVLVVILIIWGPGKLPDIGAGIGNGIREFRKASSDPHDSDLDKTTATPAQSVPLVAAPAPAQQEPMTVPADAATPQS